MAFVEFVRLGQSEVGTQQVAHGALAEPIAVQPPLAARRDQPIRARVWSTQSHRVPLRLGARRSAQNPSNPNA